MKKVIQFLSFDACPLAGQAIENLENALGQDGLERRFTVQRVNVLDPGTDERLRRWGSPTFLLDGRDLFGAEPADGPGCRVYGAPGGVPSIEQLRAILIATWGEK